MHTPNPSPTEHTVMWIGSEESYGNNKVNEAKNCHVMDLRNQGKAWQLPLRFLHALSLKTLEENVSLLYKTNKIQRQIH